MKSAYRYDQTLFITALDTWAQRSEDDRQATLKAIMDKPGFKYRTVVVMSETGAMLENVSRDGLSTDSATQPVSDLHTNQ